MKIRSARSSRHNLLLAGAVSVALFAASGFATASPAKADLRFVAGEDDVLAMGGHPHGNTWVDRLIAQAGTNPPSSFLVHDGHLSMGGLNHPAAWVNNLKLCKPAEHLRIVAGEDDELAMGGKFREANWRPTPACI